jgi:hypothetical protein
VSCQSLRPRPAVGDPGGTLASHRRWCPGSRMRRVNRMTSSVQPSLGRPQTIHTAGPYAGVLATTSASHREYPGPGSGSSSTLSFWSRVVTARIDVDRHSHRDVCRRPDSDSSGYRRRRRRDAVECGWHSGRRVITVPSSLGQIQNALLRRERA